MSTDPMPIYPPLTANETAVFDALTLGYPEKLTAAMVCEVTGLDEFRVERALRSLGSRNPPLAVATRLACLHWQIAC
jgi:hypothetical protein